MRLTTGIATILGTVTGSTLTIISAGLQRRWKRADDSQASNRAEQREAEQRARARVETACDGLLDEVVNVRKALEEATEPGLPQSLHQSTERMERYAALLPTPDLRERAHTCANLIWFGDELPPGDGPPDPVTLAWLSTNDLQDIATALLREEVPPAEPAWYAPCRARYVALEAAITDPNRSFPLAPPTSAGELDPSPL